MRKVLTCWLLFLLICVTNAADSKLPLRGYYMTFMRMPNVGLPEWKQLIDCIHEDDGNIVLLWIGGGFKSEKSPITWRYNHEHKNVQRDFLRELIEYAHSRQIQVLLCFTPFGYDGVNQYPIEHPELKARKADGKPVDAFGIHCWGWSLCPSQPKSQQFMMDYATEILERYPNADGLLLESSDYNICRCQDCSTNYYEREFAFVKSISEKAWARKPNARIMVYPHYFSGKLVNKGTDIETKAASFALISGGRFFSRRIARIWMQTC